MYTNRIASHIIVTSGDIRAGRDANIRVNTDSDTTGTVTCTLNGSSYSNTIINGSALITIPAADLSVGSHTVSCNYEGNSKYLPANNIRTYFSIR